MRKSELRFATAEDALEYIRQNNWDYVGRRGLFRKYDRYEGSSFYRVAGSFDGREFETRWCLKMFPDGYVSVKSLKDTSGSLPTGGFGVMWSSRQARDFSEKLTGKVNFVLSEHGSPLSVVFRQHPSEFPLFMEGQENPITVLTSPLYAIDYDPFRKGLSKRAEDILYSAVNGNW